MDHLSLCICPFFWCYLTSEQVSISIRKLKNIMAS
jgi:hypothetical protein